MRKLKSSNSFFFLIFFVSLFLLGLPKNSFAAATNLIVNPSLETANGALPANWSQGQWGTLSAMFAYPVAGHTGNGAKVTLSSYSSGDAKWYFDDVSVTAGKQYLFSDWSNSNVSSAITVRVHLASGTDQYIDLGTINGSNTWQQFSNAFIAPIGAVSVTVFHVIAKTGALTVDDYSLTEVAPIVITPTTNLVPNPSFETASGNLPMSWLQGQWGTLSAAFAYPVTGHTGKGAKITVSSYANGDAKWYFSEIPVTAGDLYVFSDWSNGSVGTSLTVQFHLADGTYQYLGLGSVAGTNAWKQFNASFVAPVGATSMTIFHVIKSKGTLMVDDYSLLDKGAAPKFSEGMISFTFDDGYENIFTSGLPILDKAGIKSTQAIITTGTFTDPDYMTAAQVKTIAANGHEIASHTRTHSDLLTLTAAKAKTEITGSRSDLATLLGIAPNSFMYPLGSYNDAIVSLVKGAGYTGARTTDTGYNTPSSDPYTLRSQGVNNDVSIGTIKSWIDTAIANKTWLILTLHEQAVLPNIPANLYSNDPAILQQIVDYVKLKNMKTVTFGQGVSMLAK